MVTSRAVLFGFIGGCFYLIAVVNSLPPLFLALMWLTAGIVVSCFGLALLSLYGLRTSWKLESAGVAQAAVRPGPATARDDDGNLLAAGSAGAAVMEPEPPAADAGAPVGIALEVGNAGTFGKSDIVIEVHLRALKPEPKPDAARQSAAEAPGSARAAGPVIVRRFLIEALPSRAQLVTFLPLHDLERGRYRIFLVRAVGSDVLGLFRPRKKIAPSGSQPGEVPGAQKQPGEFEPVVVGPRVVRLERRQARAAMGAGGSGGRTASLAGRSDEFGGTRPYVAGDDLRFVHWKSTARRGEMVVREWERASLHHSLVLWDGAAFPTSAATASARATSTSAASPTAGASSGAPAAGAPTARARLLREAEAGVVWRRGVEWSLEVALSLANALAESGEPCALWRLDAAPARAEVLGAATVARGAELLADAQAARTTPLHDALRTVAAQGAARELEGRAFVVALFASPSLLAAAKQLRGATVVLIDISRLDERNDRARRAAWRGWRQALDEGEAQLREAGLRVLRLPPAPPRAEAPRAEAPRAQGAEQGREAEQAGQDVDLWTRDALRALLGDRAGVARASF